MASFARISVHTSSPRHLDNWLMGGEAAKKSENGFNAVGPRSSVRYSALVWKIALKSHSFASETLSIAIISSVSFNFSKGELEISSLLRNWFDNIIHQTSEVRHMQRHNMNDEMGEKNKKLLSLHRHSLEWLDFRVSRKRFFGSPHEKKPNQREPEMENKINSFLFSLLRLSKEWYWASAHSTKFFFFLKRLFCFVFYCRTDGWMKWWRLNRKQWEEHSKKGEMEINYTRKQRRRVEKNLLTIWLFHRMTTKEKKVLIVFWRSENG